MPAARRGRCRFRPMGRRWSPRPSTRATDARAADGLAGAHRDRRRASACDARRRDVAGARSRRADRLSRALRPGRDEPRYLQGFALVTETRRIAVPKGASTLRFEGVAEGIVPVSAVVEGIARRRHRKEPRRAPAVACLAGRRTLGPHRDADAHGSRHRPPGFRTGDDRRRSCERRRAEDARRDRDAALFGPARAAELRRRARRTVRRSPCSASRRSARSRAPSP